MVDRGRGMKLSDLTVFTNDCTDIDYFNACKELQNKYGIPSKPYMTISRNGTWRKTQGIGRTKEGLYIHHIHEWYFLLLCRVDMAQNYSFESQQPQNLCYCTLLEHLELHFLIEKSKNSDGTSDNFGSAVIYAQIMTYDNYELRNLADKIKFKYQITDFFEERYWQKWEDICLWWSMKFQSKKKFPKQEKIVFE